MTSLWSWLAKKRQLPGPLRRLRAVIRLRRVLAVILALVLLHTALNIWAYLVLRKELKNARAAGIELNMRSYNQGGIEHGKNAAPLYQAAFELLDSPTKQELDIPNEVRDQWPERGVPSAELTERTHAFVESEPMAMAFALIERANSVAECNWGLRYEDTFAMLLTHLPGVRDAAKALLVRARLRYVTGDPSGAVADIRAVVRLAERIEPDGIVISELVQYAVVDLCERAVLNMCTAQPMDAHTALDLGEAFTQLDELTGMTEALRYEAAGSFAATEQMRGNADLARSFLHDVLSARGPWFLRYHASYPFRPLYRLDQAQLVRRERELSQLSERPYHAVKDLLSEWEDDIIGLPRTFVLTRSLAPALSKVQAQVSRGQAWARTARLGLALEAHRDKTGSYPTSLAALTPDFLSELPVDPFSGKDLLYRLSDGELVVYSVGLNGADDGGLTETGRINPGTDDIAWRVPRWDAASE